MILVRGTTRRLFASCDHLSIMATASGDAMQVDEPTPRPTDAPPPRPASSIDNAALRADPHRASSLPVKFPEMTCGFVYSAEMTQHFMRSDPTGHVEQPARITRIFELMVRNRYNIRMKQLPIRPVQKLEALLVHTEDHWNKVLAFKGQTAPFVSVDSIS